MILFDWLVRKPVEEIYLKGPIALGMWGGIPYEDVCARLTRVRAEFWYHNTEECSVIIERECASWAVFLVTLLYVFLILRLLMNVIDFLFIAKQTKCNCSKIKASV